MSPACNSCNNSSPLQIIVTRPSKFMVQTEGQLFRRRERRPRAELEECENPKAARACKCFEEHTVDIKKIQKDYHPEWYWMLNHSVGENFKILKHTVEGGPSLTILNGSGCFVEERQTVLALLSHSWLQLMTCGINLWGDAKHSHGWPPQEMNVAHIEPSRCQIPGS